MRQNCKIEVRNLKVFGEHQQCLMTVDHLSLEAGTFNVISGPSGAGKSTLLFALAGLAAKRVGQVLYQGRNILALGDTQIRKFRRQQVGFLFQDFLLFDELSTTENVSLSASFSTPKQQSMIEINTQKLLMDFGLLHREHHKAGQLSGGERQRTAIARALVHNPDIILADEPTASLDQDNAKLLIEYLRNLAHQHNKLVVLISHDPIVQARADRLLVIDNALVVAGN